ncbi:outer membrane protein assembly factor BamA [Buchnera aphidicola]|uniref:Outer membrane protein assembly factor BamA n=1 Tax=Buchnera aphidicola subsp. Rhopalosiphum maidis TaxID=118109 RepID=A0A3G2I5W7_BUCRM|nr:outer membrane protein assembly factor BamA [Buchnera aphidicola]AYN24816.1 outer membrane protein assembly factor BamA [Buchnera aphidicola (Rhopalosiphum maidis)]
MLIKSFFMIFLMFFSINVFSKNVWTIENIQFKGLKYFSKDEVLKNIFFDIGSHVSDNDIKNSIKALFKTGKFEDIKIVYSGKTIIFEMKERPIISNITFLGNKIIKDSILKQYLNKLGIKKGNFLNPFLNTIFIKNLKEFYDNIGRYHSDIKIFKKTSSHNKVDLKILIYESNLTEINHITIIGNNHFSREKIISLFKLKDRKSWWNFLEKRFYYSQQLEEDLKSLSDFYFNKGYYYFNINKKIVHFLKDQNKVNITIYISEGKQYKISSFFVNGNLLQYYQSIKDLINFDKNEVYNKEKITLIVKKIERFLSEKGYIEPKIIIYPEINFKEKKIILNFNIDIQKRYFVNKINFRGNELTQDIVLRREIKQAEGEWFNLKLIELGQKSLEKIKFLRDITVKKEILSNKKNGVDITYTLKEQPTGTLNFGLGYGRDSGLSFNASVSQDNLFGSGNSLKASVVKNNSQKYADISIIYPYFTDDGTNLNTRLFYNDFKYNINSFSNIIKSTAGFESDLSFLINTFNRMNIGFGYTHNGLINKEEKSFLEVQNTSNDKFLKNSLVDDFTLNYSLMHDTLKYFYFPVSGNQTYVSGKNTIPGSDNNFYKFLFDSEQYIPFDKEKKFIFLTHIRAGIGNSLNEEKLPFYENFHAINSNNIRGFRANTIGPKKIYMNSNLDECLEHNKKSIFCESIDSIGGNAIIISNLELITPIPLIKNEYSKFLRSSFFLDAGNIWDTKWEKKQNVNFSQFPDYSSLNNIYASIGISLQWFSPIGPLVFSYAYPIHKNENNQLEAFQFNFGKNW